jgi:hypothetical protein
MALTGKTVRVERIIEKVHRDYKFNVTVDWIDLIEWIGEALGLVGAPRIMSEKVTDGNVDLYHPDPIVIENYRGRLPYDVYEINTCVKGDTKQAMRRSTDMMHMSYVCRTSKDFICSSQYTYKCNDNYIFTSFESGTVIMSYQAFPVDERGLPTIPDNQRIIEYCTKFVANKIAFQMYLKDMLSEQKYSRIEQDYLFYAGSADTAARTPSPDDMENWKNMFIRLIPDISAHGVNFANIGNMEKRFNSTFNTTYKR